MSSQYHLITKKQEQGAKIPGIKGFCPSSEDSHPHRSHFDPDCSLSDIGSVCNTIIDHCYYLGTELGVRGLDPRRPTFLEEIYLLHDKISSLTRLASDLEDVTKNVTEIIQRQTSLEAILISESQKNQQKVTEIIQLQTSLEAILIAESQKNQQKVTEIVQRQTSLEAILIAESQKNQQKVTEIVQCQTSLEAILIAESQKNQQISSKKKKESTDS
jgi:hypothetical protein